jgi:hypothetical protein
MTPIRPFCSFLALLLLVACNRGHFYTGDGTFVDHGILSATDRYTIELGEVDVRRISVSDFSLSGLPRTDFTVGLLASTALGDGAHLDSKPLSAVVKITLVNERSQVVISEEAPLDKWDWSSSVLSPSESFVYLRGEEDEQPLSAGAVSLHPIGLKADSGWGTYFKPRRFAAYTLTFAVTKPDPSSDADRYTVAAFIRGGGWK